MDNDGQCRECLDYIWIEAEDGWRQTFGATPADVEDFDDIAARAIALIATLGPCPHIEQTEAAA